MLCFKMVIATPLWKLTRESFKKVELLFEGHSSFCGCLNGRKDGIHINHRIKYWLPNSCLCVTIPPKYKYNVWRLWKNCSKHYASLIFYFRWISTPIILYLFLTTIMHWHKDISSMYSLWVAEKFNPQVLSSKGSGHILSIFKN